jgi:hypothetical protein
MRVYVMTNPAMPGIVKIGRSVAPDQRVIDLSRATAVPLPFVLEYDTMPEDDIEAEMTAHKLLAEYRVNPSREFFRVSVQKAIETVQYAALMSAWNKASAEARQEFLERIDTPVFDKARAA